MIEPRPSQVVKLARADMLVRIGMDLDLWMDSLLDAARRHLEPLFARRYLGLTLQIDEGQEVFDAKHSTIHPLFKKE